jgi:release factor glutamine methyltransferase
VTLVSRCLDRLRRAPLLTRALFGVRVPSGTRQAHWDLATLALRTVLREQLRPRQGVLEVGTGECATLATWLALRHDGPILAFEVSEEALESARRVAAANGVSLRLRRSDLLGALEPGDAVDLVVFNPPFVPTATGHAAGLQQREPARVWDGGDDGLAVIRRFAAQCARLPSTVTILLAVNSRVVEPAALRAVVAEARLTVLEERRGLASPALVMTLRPGGLAHLADDEGEVVLGG